MPDVCRISVHCKMQLYGVLYYVWFVFQQKQFVTV